MRLFWTFSFSPRLSLVTVLKRTVICLTVEPVEDTSLGLMV
ncbi:hypothetical protein ASZ90_016487 [hydrocarbon metagenome]|uniref:Uncharacterized protein n=1 Tax=hydrocarbon metagenome TaxID=938273 RepID=A0A0W8ERD7_9ZZZZ